MSIARSPRSIGRSVVAASFGFALIQLDVTIVNVALPTMKVDLATGIAGLQWVIDAYALVFAAVLLSAGYLADVAGAKRVYLAGLTLFGAASLACGAAPAVGALIVARGLQGVGAAAMLPSSLALLNHACSGDPKLRGWAIGWWTSSSSAALASGPVIGGALVHWAGWRWIFLVNLPLCLLAAWLVLRLPETGARPHRQVDVPGQILGAIAMAALTAAVIEAGPRGIADATVLSAAAVATLAAAAFVMVERSIADPMLPRRMFDSSMVPISLIFGAVVNLTYYGSLFILSLYLQQALAFDAVQAGLAFLPLTATFLAVNALGGRTAGRIGARWPMAAGASVSAIGYALLLLLDGTRSVAAMAVPFVLMPIGMGFAVPAMTAGVLASVEPALSGTIAAALNAARQAGGVFGVALFGALAAGNPGGIIAGLHQAAVIAALLMGGIAILAGFGLRPAR